MLETSVISSSQQLSSVPNEHLSSVPNPLLGLGVVEMNNDDDDEEESKTTNVTPVVAPPPVSTTATTTGAKPPAPSTKQAAKPPTPPPPATTSSDDTTTPPIIQQQKEVILSLKDPIYKDIIWTQFNILGKVRDQTKEEKAGYELWSTFMNNDDEEEEEEGRKEEVDDEPPVFYRVERNGNRIRLSNEEALERITRDMKRRIETVHHWYGKKASSDAPSPPSSQKKTNMSREVASLSSALSKSKSSSTPEKKEKTIVVANNDNADSRMPASPSATIAQQTSSAPPTDQRKSPRVQQLEEEEKAAAEAAAAAAAVDAALAITTLPSTTTSSAAATFVEKPNPLSLIPSTGGPNEPTPSDIILSLYDAKYRDVMFNCFLELNKDESRKKELGIQIFENFKKDGGRFFKVERGGRAYVEVGDALALQKISGDIGRRSETQKRWNVESYNEGGHASSSAGQWHEARAERAAAKTQAMSSQLSHNQHLYAQEEKKQDDNYQYDGGGVSLSDNNVVVNQQLIVSAVASTSSQSSKSYETLEPLFQTTKRSSSNIMLSLNDDYYKAILWKHYKILGKNRDSEKEAVLANWLFVMFKKELGDSGKFMKQTKGQPDNEVNDQLAFDKIIADIRRRMKNYRKWGVPETSSRQRQRKSTTATAPRKVQPPLSPPRTKRDRNAKITTPGNLSGALPPIRSTRNPMPNNDDGRSSGDILLSLNDEEYKKLLYKHYNLLGKKRPNDRIREEAHAMQVFLTLKKKLGKSGRFFKKIAHGDLHFAVDDDVALAKITRDMKRRNESVHKWLIVGGYSASNHDQQMEQPLPPTFEEPYEEQYDVYEEEMEDYEPLPITKEHVWRDQLSASPIEMNYIPRSKHHPGGDNLNGVHKSEGNPIVDLLAESHLGQRLPPFKQIPATKNVHTVNQLINILQLATHKVNELNGTHTKHCKVIRLYNLPEFNDFDSSILIKAPSVVEIAAELKTTQKSLKKWYTMYLNALKAGFDFDKFGENKVKDHYEVFNGKEVSYHIDNCAESLISEYFEQIGKQVIEDVENDRKNSTIAADGGGDYNVFDATPGDDSDPWNEVYPRANDTARSTFTYSDPEHRAPPTKVDIYNFPSDHDDKSPFQRNFDRMQARLDECGGSMNGMVLDTNAKRIKRGTKDRMLCMILGCEKHAQTRSDGCCNSHFRIISTAVGKVKGKGKKNAPQNQTNLAITGNTPIMHSRSEHPEPSATLGKRKFDDVATQVVSLKDHTISDKLDVGSRIYVEWDGDNSLYKATVKKIDREAFMAKIHYDGKKRHILDNIALEMVHSFINDENQAVRSQQEAGRVIDAHANFFQMLQKKYTGTLPPGKSEVTQDCPELGPGWNIHVATRNTDEQRTDRYFIAPSGVKFRSVPDVERYLSTNPGEFSISRENNVAAGKAVPEIESEHLDEEVFAINQQHLSSTHLQSERSKKPKLSVDCDGTDFPTDFSPIYAQRGPKPIGTRSMITISPITTGPPSRNNQSTGPNLQNDVRTESSGDQSARAPLVPQNPEETSTVINNMLNGQLLSKSGTRSKSSSAFSSTPPKPVRPTLHHRIGLDQISSSTSPNRAHFPAMRGAILVKLQGNDLVGRRGVQSKRRRKRKPKPTQRFEKEARLQNSPYARPPKDARPKDARSKVFKGGPSKSALCHCPFCEKGNLTVQGMYAHYGRAHQGNVPWKSVTYSCPYCPSSKTTSRIFRSYYDLEAHVQASHPGCNVEGPHPDKLAGLPGRVRRKRSSNASSNTSQQVVSNRVMRERRTASDDEDYSSDSSEESVDEGPPRWDKLEYVQLLPDGRKEYPSDIYKVIDMMEEHCEKQEAVVEDAREQRLRLCKSEAEKEARELAEEKLLHQRGVRERARFAESERIEKHRYTERHEQQMMLLEYQNRNKRRNQEEVAFDKLCSQPIRFSKESLRQNASRERQVCDNDQCHFCKKEKSYLQCLLLENELSKFSMDAPPSESPLVQSTQVLKPNIRVIDDTIFSQHFGVTADDANDDGKKKDNVKQDESSAGKRVNQSRRDASTAKRIRTEEDKLLMLKNTQRSLEFIKKYNDGLIANAWGDIKKDTRKKW